MEPVLVSEPPTWPFDTTLSLLRNHLRSDADAARRVERMIMDGELDCVIVRLLLPTRSWLTVAATGRLALEIHSPLWRPESARDLPRTALGTFVGGRLVARAKAGFFITKELQDLQEYRKVADPFVLGNGIGLGTPFTAPMNARARVGLVVGSTSRWQGIDRFAAWADALPKHEFVVIAPASLEGEVRSAIRSEHLQFVPTTDLSSYHSALQTLDAAVSGLAYDRRKMAEAAPLKVRDYVNGAIPTILLYTDTNLSTVDDPAILHLPRWDDFTAVDQWLQTVRGQRVSETARQAISIDAIERKRLHHLGMGQQPS